MHTTVNTLYEAHAIIMEAFPCIVLEYRLLEGSCHYFKAGTNLAFGCYLEGVKILIILKNPIQADAFNSVSPVLLLQH